MDSNLVKHSSRAPRSSTSYTPFIPGLYRPTRIQRHNFKWRRDHNKGNFRYKPPYRKNDQNNRKVTKSVEDVEEEERKKKLTDTANKLLNKLKSWSAENNCSEKVIEQDLSASESVNKTQPKDFHNPENKPKRIAHSRKIKSVKNRTSKTLNKPKKPPATYDVNKETVKNFQNRIQHKLIEDIMQMPKENLQSVINDPKINRIMEVKMSRLVEENRPLIAQKLRALAESKMKSVDSASNSQLLMDIDKLIDPVIETDLSALPIELIRQMENVFQVKFDFSSGNVGADDNEVTSANVSIEGSCFMDNAVMDNREDFRLYECSTDEDDDVSDSKLNCMDAFESNTIGTLVEGSENNIMDTSMNVSESNTIGTSAIMDFLEEIGALPLPKNTVRNTKKRQFGKESKSPKKKVTEVLSPTDTEDQSSTDDLVSEVVLQNLSGPVHNECTDSIPCKEFASVETQAQIIVENRTTQTTNNLPNTLYDAAIPEKAKDESISSLLNEVNAIQALINKLNERRFMIFLKLAQKDPSGGFILDETTRSNFTETVTNGDSNLTQSLIAFFSHERNQSQNYYSNRSNDHKTKSKSRWSSKHSTKNRQ